MLSKLSLVFAVAALTLAGEAVEVHSEEESSSSNTIEAQVPESASLSGSLLSWQALGTPDVLLGPETLARLSLLLDGPEGLTFVDIDGRGRFEVSGLSPGQYDMKLIWDGSLLHEHALYLAELDGAVASIRVAERESGDARVEVKLIGDSSGKDYRHCSNNGIDGEGFQPAVVLEQDLPRKGPRATGIRPPAQTTLFELDEGDWADDAMPSSLPEILDTQMIVDPDVNVSKVHENHPMGFTGQQIQAI